MANHVLHTQTTGPLFDKILICGWTVVVKVLTARKISKDVVALLWEGDFVDSVADEAGFQQVASVLSCFTAVCKPLHVMKQPVNHVRACKTTYAPIIHYKSMK